MFDSEKFDASNVEYPVIVKPKMESVSLGLKVVDNEQDLSDAVRFIINEFKHNQERLKNRVKLMDLINEKTELISSNKLLKECKENYIPIGKIKRISEVLNSSLANEMTLEEKIDNQTTKRIKTVAFKLDS